MCLDFGIKKLTTVDMPLNKSNQVQPAMGWIVQLLSFYKDGFCIR